MTESRNQSPDTLVQSPNIHIAGHSGSGPGQRWAGAHVAISSDLLTSEVETIAFVLKHTLTFLVHQLISTYGVIVGTAAATYDSASLLNILISSSRSLRPSWLLTTVPGFPLQ